MNIAMKYCGARISGTNIIVARVRNALIFPIICNLELIISE
jgi:hypothetical protein